MIGFFIDLADERGLLHSPYARIDEKGVHDRGL